MKNCKLFGSWLTVALIFGMANSARAEVCVGVKGKIPFSGSFIFTDGANFVGGDLPQMGFTTGSFFITTSESGGEWMGRGSQATLSFSASPGFPATGAPYPSYPSFSARPFGPFGPATEVSIRGTLQLNANGLRALQRELGSNANLDEVCVSDIAMNVGRDNFAYGGSIRGGAVYLYLNGSNRAFEVRF